MIYFIQEGTEGPIKIGVSDEPETRALTLQAGNPRLLRLVAVLDGTQATERRLHQRFAPGALAGEWFASTTPGLAEFIADVLAEPQPLALPQRRQRHQWRQPPPRVLTVEERQRIINATAQPRDEIAVRLILDYGVKRSKLRELRAGDLASLVVPHAEFWRLVAQWQAEADDYLLCPVRRLAAGRGLGGERLFAYRAFPKTQPSAQSVHRWWYRRLADAGLVEPGTTNGRGMRLGQIQPAPAATFTPRFVSLGTAEGSRRE